MKNYYLILEIQANASNEAIKRAYRRLSKLYHPDINPGGAEQFKNINEANSILSDSEKGRYMILNIRQNLVLAKIKMHLTSR